MQIERCGGPLQDQYGLDQRTLTVGGIVTVLPVYSLTRLELTKTENMLFVCSQPVESKLETSCTVILIPTVRVLRLYYLQQSSSTDFYSFIDDARSLDFASLVIPSYLVELDSPLHRSLSDLAKRRNRCKGPPGPQISWTRCAHHLNGSARSPSRSWGLKSDRGSSWFSVRGQWTKQLVIT